MKAEEAETRRKDYRRALKACSLNRMLIRCQYRLPLSFRHCGANHLESGRSLVGSFHPVLIEGLISIGWPRTARFQAHTPEEVVPMVRPIKNTEAGPFSASFVLMPHGDRPSRTALFGESPGRPCSNRVLAILFLHLLDVAVHYGVSNLALFAQSEAYAVFQNSHDAVGMHTQRISYSCRTRCPKGVSHVAARATGTPGADMSGACRQTRTEAAML